MGSSSVIIQVYTASWAFLLEISLQRIRSIQEWVKILTWVVNALTDNEFDIEDDKDRNDKDRDAIQELVEFGFGMEDNLCSEEQFVHLIDLFPERVEQFEHIIENKSTVGEFYCILFDILRYGYEYLMTFGMERVKFPPEQTSHTF